VKTFAITTFGCQMNISDSERVAAVCKSMGYSEHTGNEEKPADLYVLNTCSIRQKAEDRVLGMGKHFSKLKIGNSKLKIILTGCMAKRDIRQGFEKSDEYQNKYAGKLQKQMPWLDYVLTINDIHHLPNLLGENSEEKVEDYLSIKPKYDSKFQAFVPISTGCNKFCTFCIVPFTRGKEVYRPFDEIYNEVKNLVEDGYKEITLLGQNVNSWRSDNNLRTPITPLLKISTWNLQPSVSQRQTETFKIPEGTEGSRLKVEDSHLDFADLMESLADIPGDFWLRFTSSHPYDINMRLVNVVAEKKNIAKQFHFALQSGSDTVLKRMNRFYTRDEFKDKVLEIKKTISEVGITTDVIVGFSGESDKEFEDTVKLCEELQFDQIFISEYSRREGTIAAKFYNDDISREVKAQRKETLDQVLKKGLAKNNEKLIGTIQKVLIYKTKSKNKEGIFGRTTHAKDVLILAPSLLAKGGDRIRPGQFINVKITGFKKFCLEGEIV
jgi:tRNA-2-methylthio-N6-dimethylallyladenosine synthase